MRGHDRVRTRHAGKAKCRPRRIITGEMRTCGRSWGSTWRNFKIFFLTSAEGLEGIPRDASRALTWMLIAAAGRTERRGRAEPGANAIAGVAAATRAAARAIFVEEAMLERLFPPQSLYWRSNTNRQQNSSPKDVTDSYHRKSTWVGVVFNTRSRHKKCSISHRKPWVRRGRKYSRLPALLVSSFPHLHNFALVRPLKRGKGATPPSILSLQGRIAVLSPSSWRRRCSRWSAPFVPFRPLLSWCPPGRPEV